MKKRVYLLSTLLLLNLSLGPLTGLRAAVLLPRAVPQQGAVVTNGALAGMLLATAACLRSANEGSPRPIALPTNWRVIRASKPPIWEPDFWAGNFTGRAAQSCRSHYIMTLRALKL